jgi:hypothetical protein
MFTANDTCGCTLRQSRERRAVDARRHAGYRELAHVILGLEAPTSDAKLARALAAHARLLQPAGELLQLIERRRAA